MAKAPIPRIPKPSKIEDRLIGDYPSHRRGLVTNRYGNNRQHERGLRGGTYGLAGPYTEYEEKEYAKELRLRGEFV
jgi:hypothetical protein